MLRLLLVLSMLSGVGLVAVALPATDEEQQLQAVVGIALEGTQASERVFSAEHPVFAANPKNDAAVSQALPNEPATVFPPGSVLFAEAKGERRSVPRRIDHQNEQRSADTKLRSIDPNQKTGYLSELASKAYDFNGSPAAAVDPARLSGREGEQYETTVRSEVIANRVERAVPQRERRNLARQLQRLLRQAGCYQGRIDGIWGRKSRRAVERFAEITNADWLMERPSGRLLDALNSFDGRVCPQNCGRDQVLDNTGRCIEPTRIASIEGGVSEARKTTKAAKRRKLAASVARAPKPNGLPRRTLKTKKKRITARRQTNAPTVAATRQRQPNVAKERTRPAPRTNRKKPSARDLALAAAPAKIAKGAKQAARKQAKRRATRAKQVARRDRARAKRKARIRRVALRQTSTRRVVYARRVAIRRAAARRAQRRYWRRNRYGLGANRYRQRRLRSSRLRRAYRASARRRWIRKAFALGRN